MTARRLAGCLALLCAVSLAAPPYRYFRAGNPAHRAGAVQGGLALLGGGTDVDAAFQWMCRRSGGGDFLVLRASGTAAYNPYIQKLCPGENSVATLILPSRAAADDPFAARTIAAASAIFISGGDQSNYVNFWAGSPVQSALDRAIRRGVPIGGTSAGLAVLGEFAYSAQHDLPNGPNLTSARALANPFDPQITLVRGFLDIPLLRGLVTDTHFHARDRLGRLLAFMARAPARHGLGVDQHTAMLVSPNGGATVTGTGVVYAFSADSKPQTCQPGVPLTFYPIYVQRLASGEMFSLKTWSGDGIRYTLEVRTGRIVSSQPGGSPY